MAFVTFPAFHSLFPPSHLVSNSFRPTPIQTPFQKPASVPTPQMTIQQERKPRIHHHRPNPPIIHPNNPHHPIPHLPNWYYSGPPLSHGPLPAIIYLALTGPQSLSLPPYNTFVPLILNTNANQIRVFSITLPFHGTMQTNTIALNHWARSYANGADIISAFVKNAVKDVLKLVKDGWIANTHGAIGIAGLSRGALIASHLALGINNQSEVVSSDFDMNGNGGIDKKGLVKAVLGFAPVTVLGALEEFESHGVSEVADKIVGLQNEEYVWGLARRIQKLRFYVGNNDRTVGTMNVVKVAQAVTEKKWKLGVRRPELACVLYCSVGGGGHGTPDDIFKDGAKWMREALFD